MIHAQISAVDYHLPDATLDNDELLRIFPDLDAQALHHKVGVSTRRIAAIGESALDLAVAAAEKLISGRQIDRASIDAVLLCSQSLDQPLPTGACVVQERLRLPKQIAAFDVGLGCSGFIYALAVAKGLVETGTARTVLVLTTDTYSRYLDPADRAVRTVFGDGAAATLIRGVECADGTPPLLGPFVLGSDGAGAEHLTVERRAGGGWRLRMNGPAILSFTLQTIPKVVEELLAKAKATHDSVDLFVFHQASRVVLDSLMRRCGIPSERFVIDIVDKGNTVSSTIPIALASAATTGRIPDGTRAMLVGFGVGLSWGAAFAVLPSSLALNK